VEGSLSGVSYNTLTIDVPIYLNYILSRFLSKGGSIVRGNVQHISQVVEGGADVFMPGCRTTSPPDAVVICTGLLTRFLGGVEDKDVYPVRGQTVVVRAPWVKSVHIKINEKNVSYIIPRKSGDVSSSIIM
jgi:glycine/D-amino acid oxidase-like deaminating enzyme